jgi:hypothetical protein
MINWLYKVCQVHWLHERQELQKKIHNQKRALREKDKRISDITKANDYLWEKLDLLRVKQR